MTACSVGAVVFASTACHRTAPSTADASGATFADAAAVADARRDAANLDASPGAVDGAPPGASADSGTDAATTSDGADDTGTVGEYVHPTDAELAITSWSSPEAIAHLATSCTWMTGSYPGTSDERPLACGSGLELQACAPGECDRTFVGCESTCGETCGKCAAACTDTCASCEATCTDSACRTACATSTARCRQACVHARDTCSTAGCSAANDACEKKRSAKWVADGCAGDCDMADACIRACDAKEEMSDCEERCTKKSYLHCKQPLAEFRDHCRWGS